MSLLILGVIAGYIFQKNAETGYIKNPKAGDIYLLKDANISSYYFMKVLKVQNDSIIVNHNAIQYAFYVSKPQQNDSFMIEELWISKKDLQEMYDKEIIQSVDR